LPAALKQTNLVQVRMTYVIFTFIVGKFKLATLAKTLKTNRSVQLCLCVIGQ